VSITTQVFRVHPYLEGRQQVPVVESYRPFDLLREKLIGWCADWAIGITPEIGAAKKLTAEAARHACEVDADSLFSRFVKDEFDPYNPMSDRWSEAAPELDRIRLVVNKEAFDEACALQQVAHVDAEKKASTDEHQGAAAAPVVTITPEEWAEKQEKISKMKGHAHQAFLDSGMTSDKLIGLLGNLKVKKS
jgi:hypothetical protein